MIFGGRGENVVPGTGNGSGFRLPTTVDMASLLLLLQAAGMLLISKTHFNLYLLFSALLLAFLFFFYRNLRVGNVLARVGFLLYGLWLLRGLSNPAVHIDFKYHLAWILTFLVFVNLLGKVSVSGMFRYLFRLNILLFVVYLLLLVGAIPNFYVGEDLPEYQSFRIFGPVVVPFYALCMVANYPGLADWPQRNLYLLTNFMLGSVVAILLGSLQHFAIFFLIYLATCFRRRHLLRFLGVFGVAVALFAGAILFFGTEQHQAKFMQLLNPLQSPTLLTRANDLFYVLEQKRSGGQVLFGAGPGVTSEVFRISTRGGSLVEFREFLEIDNGFYYVYHRAGLIGLGLFLFFHGYLLKNYGNFRNRVSFLAFFLITNALSIHYFTNPMSALMGYLLLRHDGEGEGG